MRMQEETQIAERPNALVEVLATVSHELRSPLTAIQGYTFTLLRHIEDISREEQREFLLAIDDASKHLGSLIARILELSQLEAGTITLDCSHVNVVALLNEVITRHTAHPGFHPFILTKETEHSQADTLLVDADYHRLLEVIDLLIENAESYSTSGESIELGAHRIILHEQPVIELWVHDHGSGIPVEQFDNIFHQFHRLDSSLTREINGLGLGLTICKHIVEMHEGTIHVESETGKGSTFCVRLPEDHVGTDSSLPYVDG